MSASPSRLVVVTVVKDDIEGFERTCASISTQSRHVEHLIIDGGSAPPMLECARKWAAELGSVLISEPDRGTYDAMNKALDQLNGHDRVWFLNAGDVFASPEAYAYVDERSSADNFTWGFGPVRVMEINGRLRHIPKQAPYSRRNYAYGRTPICHQAAVCRVRDLRAVGGFDERYSIRADYRALLLLSQISEPVHWDMPTVEYHAGGISDRFLLRGHWQEHRVRREILGRGPVESARSLGYVSKMALRITTGRSIDALARRGIVDTDWRSRRGQ
ncbi:MAG: hypothetical protein Q7L55_10040 [Actinomycetota bacterium]|nr:hypothetical protein [Actinomycetota bacterium]